MDESVIHAVNMRLRHMNDEAVLQYAEEDPGGGYISNYAHEIVRLRDLIRSRLSPIDAARLVPMVEEDDA